MKKVSIPETQLNELINSVEALLAWANIKDGSPSQSLRDGVINACERVRASQKAAHEADKPFTLGNYGVPDGTF